MRYDKIEKLIIKCMGLFESRPVSSNLKLSPELSPELSRTHSEKVQTHFIGNGRRST